MKAVIVVNRGKSFGGGLSELRARLEREPGIECVWCEVDKSKHIPDRLAPILDTGVDRVMVWGGDGTVRRCIDTILAGREADDAEPPAIEIGILPAGTANLLARNLGVPTDVEGALEIALRGEAAPIDLGEVVPLGLGDAETGRSHHFAVMAGAGFDARLLRAADDGPKEHLGRLGYVWSGMRDMPTERIGVTVEVDGDLFFEGQASTVFFSNVSTILGGLQVTPDASPFDGRLHVVVATAETHWQWLSALARTLTGPAERDSNVTMTTGHHIVVNWERPMAWEVDGGDRDPASGLDVRCRPGAVQILRARARARPASTAD